MEDHTASRRCDACDATFTLTRSDRRFCSDACRYRAKGNTSRSKPPATCPTCATQFAQRRGARDNVYCSPACVPAKEAAPPSSPVRYRHCKQCSRWMVDRSGRQYCSDECRLSQIADRVMGFYATAMRELDVPKAVMWRRKLTDYLAQRDGCACGICGKRVDVTLSSGPRGNPLGPSIDHVVPRSHGGTDDLANLRLTHWSCNRQRGNRGVPEQLRLVG